MPSTILFINSVCGAQISLSNKHDLFVEVYFLNRSLLWKINGSVAGITRFFSVWKGWHLRLPNVSVYVYQMVADLWR